MSYIIDLENIKHNCRVCLTSNNQMIALTCKLNEESDESPQICDALENIFSTQVHIDSNYPEGVCLACYKKIKISYALKTTFTKSQNILETYVATLNVDNCNSLDGFQNTEDSLFEEDVKDILEADSVQFVKQEYEDEELALTDFVILEVTDDTDEEELIEIENHEDIIKEEDKSDVQSLNSDEVTAEAIDSDEYKVQKIVSTPKASYSCPFCHRNLLTKRKLEQHTKICQKYALEKCEFCDQQFSSFSRKHYHIKMKHSTDIPKELKCQICDEVFESQKTRSYHIKTKHAKKRFDCKICGKAFHFKNGLAIHMDTHSKDRYREICPECGKGFHYRGGLFYHMKIHRNERNYLCTYCSAQFLNLSGLKKHVRIHTGEKPCQCEYCGKSFRSTSILKKHEKTHTGHRPHSCNYCGKGFISKYNLMVHMAGHSGNNPCAFCDKSYLNEEVLKLHMRFKHNIRDGDFRPDDLDS